MDKLDEVLRAYEAYISSQTRFSWGELHEVSERLHKALTTHRAEQKQLRECVRDLGNAARGLSFGTDWNNGTHAKTHRPDLISALEKHAATIKECEEK